MKNNLRNENQKKSNKKGYESILLLLLTISLFVTATYAWFTDSAYSKGNKIFSGNMFVDVIATEEEAVKWHNLNDYYNLIVDGEDEGDDVHDEAKTILEGLGYKQYTRTYPNEDGGYDTDYYYIITNTDASAVNLYNLEPGQARKVSVKYLNNGDLALRAAGALKIDVEINEEGNIITDDNGNPLLKSYTGLQTLILQGQNSKKIDVYHNNYVVDENNTIDPKNIYDIDHDDDLDNDSYYITTNDRSVSNFEKRTSKLLKYQALKDDEGNYVDLYTLSDDEYALLMDKYNIPAKDDLNPMDYLHNTFIPLPGEYAGSAFVDIGGHLEDVLEVYIGVDEDTDREVFRGRDKKDNPYYFGTIKEFEFLLNNGPSANKDFDRSYYSDAYSQGEYALKYTTKQEEGSILPPSFFLIHSLSDCRNPEEQYMFLHKDATKSLYDDYKRYLNTASGHCLPKDALLDNNKHLPSKDGVTVKVYEDNKESYEYMASEIGETNFVIYMPETVDSRYQNASISLSLGVTATQVEYEMDDLGIMIYDKPTSKEIDDDDDDDKEEILVGDLIKLTNENNGNFEFYRVLDIDGDNVTIVKSTDQPGSIEGKYESSDGRTSFSSLNNGLEQIYLSFNYNGSSFQNSIYTVYESFIEAYPSIKDSLVPVDTTQYYFTNETKLIFEPSLQSLSSISNSYTLDSKVYNRAAYNHIGELSVRSLSLTDIFECLNKIGVEANPTNVKRLVAYNPLGNTMAIFAFNIPLMDVYENGFYYLSAPTGYINYYDYNSAGMFMGSFLPFAVYTFDKSKFDSYKYYESFDGTKRGSEDDDSVVIGIVSSNFEQKVGIDINSSKYLKEAINTRLNLPCNFNVVSKYLQRQFSLDVVDYAAQQLNNAKSLIDESKAKYLIVETMDGTLKTEISEYANSKGVEVFYVGFDYPVSKLFKDSTNDKYLADESDIMSTVAEIANGSFDNIGSTDLSFAIFYNSQNSITSGLFNELSNNADNYLSGFNKYSINHSVDKNNKALTDDDYKNVHNYECNVILMNNVEDLVIIKAYEDTSNTLVYIHYLDNIDNTPSQSFEYFGVYYNYDEVCENILSSIIADITHEQQRFKKISLLSYIHYNEAVK